MRELIEWWEMKRPITWSLEQHLENPTINCQGNPESNLALLAAKYAKNNGWTLCEDELPEDRIPVWITDGETFASIGCRVEYNFEDGLTCWAVTQETPRLEGDEVVFDMELTDIEVVAWRSLPELFKQSK